MSSIENFKIKLTLYALTFTDGSRTFKNGSLKTNLYFSIIIILTTPLVLETDNKEHCMKINLNWR